MRGYQKGNPSGVFGCSPGDALPWVPGPAGQAEPDDWHGWAVALGDFWNAQIEAWTAVTDTELAAQTLAVSLLASFGLAPTTGVLLTATIVVSLSAVGIILGPIVIAGLLTVLDIYRRAFMRQLPLHVEPAEPADKAA